MTKAVEAPLRRRRAANGEVPGRTAGGGPGRAKGQSKGRAKGPAKGQARSADRADSRAALLRAGRAAFAAGGLEGARVDEIAALAGVNKQLVYHYFGSKDGLYVAVLEEAYHEIRQREQELDLSELPPREAMRRLVEFSFDFLDEHRDFVALIADENTHGARHMAGSEKLTVLNRPVIELMHATLERGVASGDFREGLDPLQVYISVAGLAYFYFANIHTLSRIFESDLARRSEIAARRAHVVEFALAAVSR